MHKIAVSDLPAPFATSSAGNAPTIVARPADAWPKAPKGFKVGLYSDGLATPRVIRVAPNGDVFVAESGGGRIRVFRGLNADGKPERSEVFAENLNKPYGIAFYPAGPDPKWIYVGDTDSVMRFPYRNGDLKATGVAEHVVDLPHGSGHWTRDIVFSADGKTLFVAVGSGSNVDDPDTTPAERYRADILAFDPDGSHMRVYASGIRNPSGLAVDPRTGRLWCTVNERDGLGDNLVPDYITSVRDGRLLRLAVVVHGPPPGSPSRRQAPGTAGAGHHARRAAPATQRLSADCFLPGPTVPRMNTRGTSSPPSMALGTSPFAPATRLSACRCTRPARLAENTRTS